MGSQSAGEELGTEIWAVAEMRSADLGDERLNRRLALVLRRLAEHPEKSIAAASNGWGETQGAYRFLDNEKVTPEKVLSPHREATLQRVGQHPVVLCVEDTSELDFTSKSKVEGLGPLNYEGTQGLYIHPMLAITPERLCLGVLDLWRWVRDGSDHGGKDRRDRLSRSLEQKESLRWVEGYKKVAELQAQVGATRLVYVADRDSDLFELFEAAAGGPAHWLIRAAQDRAVKDGGLIWDKVGESPSLGQITFDLPAGRGRRARQVEQSLHALRVLLRPPYRPDKKLAPVEVTVILAREDHPPPGEVAVEWLLLSSLAVETFEDACEKVQWYLCRWQIEVFFRILKSGCRVEQLQLQSRERIEVALALYLIVAWRVLYLTQLGRVVPDLSCEVAFSVQEWQAVYMISKRQKPPLQPPRLLEMLTLVAKLGGFLARKGDGPPGPKAIWIGLQRTRDFVLAFDALGAFDP
jgi:Transposase DNA-binding/Transposase Tn5 dimerisation domain